ncbi:DEAD/DEAH box helicase family protein (plasmid) [Deinococcus radiomollis]|uniref:DEAD/DEAH box helicase n=1 Tax=Deinococcus radiomollis TaxID=468916 RepID=UPI0038919340
MTTTTPTTIHDILAEFREMKRSNREMGDQFEQLFAAYLRLDPQYQELYSDVWLWGEWPDRAGKPDTGIDIVARERATGEYCAVQCKFYDDAYTLQKADIDSFFTASGKPPFKSRIIVSTTDHWSKHAEDALKDQYLPVVRVRIEELAASTIDWSTFSLKHPDQLKVRPKNSLREHQKEALTDVMAGLEVDDRGKLIMACGTGKTFTALKIAEQFAHSSETGYSGAVLFLVPSIALLSQTLREWTAQSDVKIHPFAVCSDTAVGKRRDSDSEDLSVHDLPFPATTDAVKLAAQMKKLAGQRPLTVVFSTYQSISVVAEAQGLGAPVFDLIICDEAHRTTGVTLADEEESNFVRVHDNTYLKAGKRLYMTATPRIYDEDSRSKAAESDALVVSMDDETIYGRELHRLGFGAAVERNLLTDYKVLVLAVDEKFVSKTFQKQLSTEGELNLDDVVKITGCWNGLSKRMVQEEGHEGEVMIDPLPMRRAVAFARTIKDSERLAGQFEAVVRANIQQVQEDQEQAEDTDVQPDHDFLRCEVHHVDGGMNVLRRSQELDWLKADTDGHTCRILSNARCLSEGVDVPNLDAVMFLTPRNSVVDVVQSVGRVMRRSPGKNFGYIILPIGIPAGVSPEEALKDNKKYRTVWQVLQALRAHDDRFNATVNKIELNKQKPGQINVIGIGGGASNEGADGGQDGSSSTGTTDKKSGNTTYQGNLDFDFGQWRDAIFAKIVTKVGDRRYWESWAGDVADIAERHVTRIQSLLENNAPAQAAFAGFLQGLHENINDGITEKDAIEMLSQHLITRPVFDALFGGNAFTEHNPVSVAMQAILAQLDQHALEREQESLEKFYDSVRRRASGIDNAQGKQRIILELYDTFFRTAFRSTAERLGIVYTPVEAVDFILHSVEAVLKATFGASLNDKGVHVIDPFTGTGTFMVRLLQSGLIKPESLLYKYQNELHANEIVLLAYYIAAVNIEATFNEQVGSSEAYVPFEGIVMTDTFEERGDVVDAVFAENNVRIRKQRKQPITVIVGNPPYSAGQGNENDNNQNQKYPTLDRRIEQTYVKESTATNNNSIYDSYIRAIRWASDRVKDRGIVSFVTNGSFIDGNAADGLRKSVTGEFSKLYVFNLRGNARTQGEQRRREKGNVFGEGSRTPVAITLMLKDPKHTGECELYYHDIGDYLSREEKLKIIADFGSLMDVPWKRLVPNEQGDWINQRSEEFEHFLPVGDKNKGEAIFSMFSNGLKTNRDAWAYNSGKAVVILNIERMIDFYSVQCVKFKEATYARVLSAEQRDRAVDEFIDTDPKKISWSRGLKSDLGRSKDVHFKQESLRISLYRPFFKQHSYFNRQLNDMVYQLPRLFPTAESTNLVICVTGLGVTKPFSALMTDVISDLQLQANGQCLPFYNYEPSGEALMEDVGSVSVTLGGQSYTRRENIPYSILKKYREQYQDQSIGKEDIFYYVYGLLHSLEYREQFESDLKKMLPRIPFASDFWAFSKAGRELGQWHVGYETVEPFPLTVQKHKLHEDESFYTVSKLVFGKKEKQIDRSTILYNSNVTISGIPDEAHEYIVNGKSALAWVMERYQTTTDKDSGIRNDPNDWSREHQDPQYILRLIGQVVRVSVETVRIVSALPGLYD